MIIPVEFALNDQLVHVQNVLIVIFVSIFINRVILTRVYSAIRVSSCNLVRLIRSTISTENVDYLNDRIKESFGIPALIPSV